MQVNLAPKQIVLPSAYTRPSYISSIDASGPTVRAICQILPLCRHTHRTFLVDHEVANQTPMHTILHIIFHFHDPNII
jgi:hypothetical protein